MNLPRVINKNKLFFLAIKNLGILVAVSVVIEFTSLDRLLADAIYRWEGNQWYYKSEWITAVLVHKGGKYLSICMFMTVTIMLLISYVSPLLVAWRYRFKYLLITTLIGTVLVSLLKTFSNISCPWDFYRYGGRLEYISLFEQLWIRNGSQCFPAGHASAGFAWIGLYFVGRHINASWRWGALGFVLSLGAFFGVSQQLRGAHFLSHDIWSLGICWTVSLMCYQTMLKPYEAQSINSSKHVLTKLVRSQNL